MNPQIQDYLNALLLLCMEVTREDKWHCFFDYSGHVDVIYIYANPATHTYLMGKPAPHPFPTMAIRLYRFDNINESAEEHINRVNAELDAAYAAIESLLKQEVSHAA